MKEHTVTITETLRKEISIEAKNPQDALRLVEENWKNGEYILDADDFSGVVFRTLPRERGGEAR